VRRKWAEGCSRVASSSIIKWLPQLISHFKRCVNDERECVLQVLLQLNADYPQAIYMAVRVLKHEVPDLWKKLAVPSRNSKIELFCCAVRHLQHPEHQLKNLKNVADINQVHESIFQELHADFGRAADKSDVLGDYRKTLNSKINSVLRSKLDEKMPADCQKFFMDLSREATRKGGLIEKMQHGPGKVQVTRFSRALHGLEGSGTDSLVIPGLHLAATPVRNEDAAPKLGSCDSELLCMRSQALPKRLIMRGSDGKEYWWLVKGGEDLRQDERLQQVFSSINRILASDVKCSQRRLRLETYACIPVSMTSGLLEWVQDTNPLQDYSAHDEASKLRYQKLHGGGGQAPAYVNAFKDGNIKDGNSIEQGFDALLQDIPGDGMRLKLMSNQSSAQAQYLLRANFAKSLAAMNASHYLMGIGDRHDGNTLVSNRGLLVGIDFGMAFGKATWVLPVPELVPFRLTKQMLGVLSPLDSAALLKRSMTCVLSALRANKQMLIQNLSIFLDDPTMDWLVDSKNRQGLNLEAEDGGGGGGGRAAKTSAETPLQPRQALHPAKTSAGDVSFLRDRMQVLREKLNGKHPCEVMKIDIKSSKVPWVKEHERNIAALLDRVGSVKSNRPGAFSQQPSLSAADQVFPVPPSLPSLRPFISPSLDLPSFHP
jgi:DNA-dependent protein kinase catalytic subunit